MGDGSKPWGILVYVEKVSVLKLGRHVIVVLLLIKLLTQITNHSVVFSPSCYAAVVLITPCQRPLSCRAIAAWQLCPYFAMLHGLANLENYG
jgi:hypothetical protein